MSRALTLTLLTLAVVCGVDADTPLPRGLRLNQIQLLGSHNSYKLAMAADRMAALREANPELAGTLDYAHVPLGEQLDAGVRKLELDVFYDPDATMFDRAYGPGGRSSFPVLHVQNLDDRSHCVNLLACLAAVADWSNAHPGHLPLFISFNAKDDVIDRPEFLRPRPFGEDAWQALDAELKAGLGERLLSPAEVFADGELRWPALAQARGRVLTILDEGGVKGRTYAMHWHERAMFANLPEGADGSAIFIINDPVAELERIQRLVQAGYIVRTRADADTMEARSGDTRRRDAAFASGAQLVSTDYYFPSPFGNGYQVTLPGGGAGRCNPVLVPAGCRLEPAPPAQD